MVELEVWLATNVSNFSPPKDDAVQVSGALNLRPRKLIERPGVLMVALDTARLQLRG